MVQRHKCKIAHYQVQEDIWITIINIPWNSANVIISEQQHPVSFMHVSGFWWQYEQVLLISL